MTTTLSGSHPSDPSSASPSTEADNAPGSPPPRRTLRPILMRFHFYAAILVAPFLLIAAITGGLYAFAPQIEKVIHSNELSTDSRGEALSLEKQVSAARAFEPDLPLLSVRPADGEGATTRVFFDDGRTEQSRRLAVFVDPVNAEVLGNLTSYGGSGSLPVRTWIAELHRNLHLGEPGRLYSELAASWLGVVAFAGLLLWWTGRRKESRLRPSRTGSPRARTVSWHGAVGTWAVLGFFLLSITGLTWSTYAGANVFELRTDLNWTTPRVISQTGSDDSPASLGDSPGVGYQAAFDTARAQDLSGPVEVTAPSTEDGTYVVRQLDSTWPTRSDTTSIDPATGAVVDTVRFADYPLAAKLTSWGISLHMGVLFGLINQLAMFLVAAALVVMIVTGYRMWWQRRPTRGGMWKVGRPVRRGAWRSASPAQAASVVALAAGVGWFIPLLGISLAVFLVIDLAVGLWGRRSGSESPKDESSLETDTIDA